MALGWIFLVYICRCTLSIFVLSRQTLLIRSSSSHSFLFIIIIDLNRLLTANLQDTLNKVKDRIHCSVPQHNNWEWCTVYEFRDRMSWILLYLCFDNSAKLVYFSLYILCWWKRDDLFWISAISSSSAPDTGRYSVLITLSPSLFPSAYVFLSLLFPRSYSSYLLWSALRSCLMHQKGQNHKLSSNLLSQ